MQPFGAPLVAPGFSHCSRHSTSLFASVCAPFCAQSALLFSDFPWSPLVSGTYPIRNIRLAPATANTLIRTGIVMAQGFIRRGMVVALLSGPARPISDPEARQSNQSGMHNAAPETAGQIQDGVPTNVTFKRRSEGKFRTKAVHQPHQMAKHPRVHLIQPSISASGDARESTRRSESRSRSVRG